jgi:seryl-tRNA synthetase
MSNAAQTQNLLDTVSSKANAAARQIGELMRTGKKDEAEAIKGQHRCLEGRY